MTKFLKILQYILGEIYDFITNNAQNNNNNNNDGLLNGTKRRRDGASQIGVMTWVTGVA